MESETLDKSGQPVAADRAELVARMAKDIWDAADGYITRVPWPPNGLRKSKVLVQSEAALAAVEAAGWGPRAEPVAPPEPLSAEEVEALALIAVSALSDRVSTGFLFVQDRDNWITTVRAVLAALPARFAVPVEGA